MSNDVKTDKGYRVSFDQFIDWIVSGNSEADEHWTPAYRLCGVCQVGFKFIGKSEHFNEDIQVNSGKKCKANTFKVFAKMANISTSVFPDSYDVVNSHAAKHNKHAKISSTYEMYKTVSKESLAGLYKLYVKDYEAFMYPIPEWLT